MLPAGFHFDYPTLRIPEPVNIYVSFPIEHSAPFRSSAGGPFRVLARLRQGATQAQAASEVRSIGQALAREHPSVYRDRDGIASSVAFETRPLRDAIVGDQRSLLWLLVGGTGVFRITSYNVCYTKLLRWRFPLLRHTDQLLYRSPQPYHHTYPGPLNHSDLYPVDYSLL